ncbi:calmodulin-lysine N-methyltransferase-like [Sycon ciliatum]|uniref:calmodulin-lysine N-methyltransferase-like n=1 Tax=Sycon ciliatum TaxID=27933 RepID=UPI0020A8477E|eukprot:scpid81337/ scgid1500/ Calmodulin-lysine N-methyltransferase
MGDAAGRSSTAKERWKILGNALRGKKSAASSDVSVRRFADFNLFSKSPFPNDDSTSAEDDGHTWVEYCWTCGESAALRIRHLTESVTAKDMIGFNNTGNVCVWPSEEILAHYLLTVRDVFRGKSVCELGGGMTCLAGLALSASVPLGKLLLTDGNQRSADNIACVLAANHDRMRTQSYSSRCLLWSRSCAYENLCQQFDFLVCADCFFFTEFHIDLIHVVKTLLKPDGKAIFFAPQRSGTLSRFTELAKEEFNVSVASEYNDIVQAQRQQAVKCSDSGYTEDLHYPLLVELTFKATAQ